MFFDVLKGYPVKLERGFVIQKHQVTGGKKCANPHIKPNIEIPSITGMLHIKMTTFKFHRVLYRPSNSCKCVLM